MVIGNNTKSVLFPIPCFIFVEVGVFIYLYRKTGIVAVLCWELGLFYRPFNLMIDNEIFIAETLVKNKLCKKCF